MTDFQRVWLYMLFLVVVLRHTCECTAPYSPPSSNTIHGSSTFRMSVLSTSPAIKKVRSSTLNGTSMLTTSHAAHFSSSSSRLLTATVTTVQSISRANEDNNKISSIPAVTSATPSAAITSSIPYSPNKPNNSGDDPEPETKLYIWQLVAIGCGAFMLFLFIIIGLLCYKIKVLKKKLKNSRSYSLPIKDNGAWIDSQDIPLWQKRASAVVSEQPTTENAPTLTT